MFSVELVNEIRALEINRVAAYLRPGARILELGAGSGRQAQELSKRGLHVEAIDIPSSLYAAERVFPVKDYDGKTIPFPDRSFDYVFSSNVLEHVGDLARIHAEIRRVLTPDGRAIHVLPTHCWRFWTMVSAFPAAFGGDNETEPSLKVPASRELTWRQRARRFIAPLRQPRHGERGNVVSELWLFHPRWWRKNFAANGFVVARETSMGLFYTGYMVMGRKWSLRTRQTLARFLGSACHLFELIPDNARAPDGRNTSSCAES